MAARLKSDKLAEDAEFKKREEERSKNNPAETVKKEEVKPTENVMEEPITSKGVKYSDIIVGDKRLEDILSEKKLTEPEKKQVREVFSRHIDYFKFDKYGHRGQQHGRTDQHLRRDFVSGGIFQIHDFFAFALGGTTAVFRAGAVFSLC